MFLFCFILVCHLIVFSGWAWGAGVMAVSTVSFMFLDIVKVLIIRNWSFELTAKLWPSPANREKLRKRQERASLMERIATNVGKVKMVVALSSAASKFKAGIKKRAASFSNLSFRRASATMDSADARGKSRAPSRANSRRPSVTGTGSQTLAAPEMSHAKESSASS